MIYFWIGIAGIVGTWLRYILSSWVQGWSPEALFPIGTLTVNLAGCFALGWFSQWVLDQIRISPHIQHRFDRLVYDILRVQSGDGAMLSTGTLWYRNRLCGNKPDRRFVSGMAGSGGRTRKKGEDGQWLKWR
jgi:CrcB protein